MKEVNLFDNPLYIAHNTINWLIGETGKYNTLEQANILSNTLFKKPYSELMTYQQQYILQRLTRTARYF